MCFQISNLTFFIVFLLLSMSLLSFGSRVLSAAFKSCDHGLHKMFPVLINAKQAVIPLSYYLDEGQCTPADEIVEELLLYIFY